jgi:hypothetical protein
MIIGLLFIMESNPLGVPNIDFLQVSDFENKKGSSFFTQICQEPSALSRRSNKFYVLF